MCKNWKGKLSEPEYQQFFGDEGAWRNDDHPEEHGQSPTCNTIVKHSTDGPLGSTKHYAYYVHHVRGFRGKGFMPSVANHLGGYYGNGSVTYGTNAEAYEAARCEGERDMDCQENEFRQECKEISASLEED